MLRSRVIIAAALSLTSLLTILSAPAGAIVPPRDCGTLKAKGTRYGIKADQLRCRTARTYAGRYLNERRRPPGYRCRNYGRETRIKFRCSRGVRVFFAIRR